MKKKLKTAGGVALVVYLLSHLILSRISVPIAAHLGMKEVFYYVPVQIDSIADSKMLYLTHVGLRVFYYPAWQIDHLLGGPYPMLGLPLRSMQNPN